MRRDIVSLNVWFDPYAWERRADAVFAYLEREPAGLVCLQEVTHEFEARARAAMPELDWESARGEGCDYGVMIGAERALGAWFERVDMTSYQSRVGLCARTMDGMRVTTVHLESRRVAGDVRLEQLDELLVRADDLIVGDFNFGVGWPEDAKCEEPWVDVWSALRHFDEGLTVDDVGNPMRAWMRPGRDRCERYDRAWLRRGAWRAIDVALCLDGVIEGVSPVITPSDHYGLRVTLER